MASASPYGAIAAGVLGAAGGYLASKRKPPKYKEVPGLFDEAGRKEYGRQLVEFYKGILAPDYHVLSQEDIDYTLGPTVARTAADAESASKRALERIITMGYGTSSPLAVKSLDEIDMAKLGADRQTYANLMGQAAMMKPGLQQSAAGGLGNLTLADLQHAANERSKQWSAASARASVPGGLEAALGGAASALGGGMFGGGGGGNAGYSGGSQLGVTPYQNTFMGSPTNFGGGFSPEFYNIPDLPFGQRF